MNTRTAVFTLGQIFLFSVEGKTDEEIFNKALPKIEEFKDNGENVYMYVNNIIERVWNYKSIAA